ncbi:MAG: hypothetical protein WC656_01850 [Sulfurimonas sp.]|jgi:hypothetical protein
MKKVSKKLYVLSVVCMTLLSTGCSSNKPTPTSDLVKRKDILTKPYELKITPIVGSRQNDSKVVMDMGKVMKIWIAPYKNKDTFVSAHDNFVVAKAPDFVVGETVPQSNWKSMKTPVKNIPFQFRNADLDNAEKLEEEEIVKYNNNVYEQQNDENVAKERMKEANGFDKEIKAFLNE